MKMVIEQSVQTKQISVVTGVAIIGLAGTIGLGAFLFFPTPLISNSNNVILSQPTVNTLTSTLKQKSKALKDMTTTARVKAVKEIRQLAVRRQQFMANLLRSNPKKFFQLALTSADIQKLPADLQEIVEQPVTVSGTVSSSHVDFLGHQAVATTFIDTKDQKRIQASSLDPSIQLSQGSTVTATGIQLGENMVISKVTAESSIPPENATTAVGPVKVALILVNFTDDQSQSITPEAARLLLYDGPNSISDYYHENSFDQLTLTGKNNTGGVPGQGDVHGWLTIPFTKSGCGGPYSPILQSWTDSANSLLGNAILGYDKFVYIFPNNTCSFDGAVDAIAGSIAWINGNHIITTVVGHEMGHLLGAQHASSKRCTNPAGEIVSISDTCVVGQYGDRYDIMSNNSTRHLNTYHKAQLGYYQPAEIVDITPLPTPANYTINPLEVATTDPEAPKIKTLRIPRTYVGETVQEYYYLEYRQPNEGFDNFPSTDPVVNGISIRTGIHYGHPGWNSYLLDMTPETAGVADEALSVGRTFTDSITGITVRLDSLAADKSSAVVSVSQTCGQANPSVQLTSNQYIGRPGQAIPYTLQGTNNDNARCPASTFTVTPVIPTGWIQTPEVVSFANLAPQATTTAIFTVTPPTTASDGPYEITEQVASASDPSFQLSKSLGYTIDGAAPEVVINIPTTGEALPLSGLLYIDSMAFDDNWITSMAIRIDGILVKTCPIFFMVACNYGWNMAGLSTGAHRILVTATDSAGNVGQATVLPCYRNCGSGGGGGPRKLPE